jgi:predicted transcriptional regulator
VLPSLESLKEQRKKLNLTQEKLAKLSNVSQSLIAKIESGKIVPSYENAKKIFEALERVAVKENVIAKEVMSKKLISVEYDDTLSKAISLMEKNAISQLPVFKNGSSIGSLSESIIVSNLEKIGKKDAKRVKVFEIMGQPLPIIQASTPLKAVSVLLQFNPAVLVQEKEKIIGIITRSDILHSFTQKQL